MKLLLCLLLIGCAHKTVVSTAPDPILIQDLDGCEIDNTGTNYWIGQDGMLGMGQSCAEAFEDWRHTVPQPKQSRI